MRVAVFATLLLLVLTPLALAAPQPGHPDGGEAIPVLQVDRGGPLAPSGPTDIMNLDTGNTYATIAAALADPLTLDGHTLEVQVASHGEGSVLVDKSVTLQGQTGTESVLATSNTSSSGDARGWFLVTAPNVTVRDLNFDGDGFLIWQGFRVKSTGTGITFDDCTFNDIRFQASGSPYAGNAIVSIDAEMAVTDCDFSLIGRHGIFFFGAGVTAGVASGNTYTGKGAGDWLDYGVEIGGGAVVTLTDNTITACTGVALSDGSTSAGVLASTFFGAGTTANATGNFLNANTTGFFAGYDASDVTVTAISDNDLSGNTDFGMVATSTTVTADASANWWGSNVAASVSAAISGDVDYTPWLDVGTDTGGPGFEGDFAVLHVDDDSPQTGATGRIQEGVDLVTASTVLVEPGTYVEQVIVDGMDVEIVGSGDGVTLVHAPASLATTFTTSGPNKPVISAMNTDSVIIRDLTVDGLGVGNANNRIMGVGFWNAGGALLDATVQNVIDTPFSGVQHGIGILAANNTGGPYALEVGNVVIQEYQKNGTAFTGGGLTVDMHDCTVIGKGATTTIAQNGIQFSGGAGGAITNCDVSDMDYTPDSYVSSGILCIGATPVDISGGSVTDVQESLYYIDTDGAIGDLTVTGGSEPYDAFFIYNTSTSAALNPLAAGSQKPVASPFTVGGGSGAGAGSASAPSAVMTVTIDQSCFTDPIPGPANTGIFAWTDGGPLDVTVTNTRVSGYDGGMRTAGGAVLTATNNHISGNTTSGYDNTGSGNAQVATLNYWGANDGPSGDGPGSGNAVLSVGGEVDFSSWRTDGASTTACAFNPVSGNSVDPVPDVDCVSTANPCVDVDFEITRADAIDMRGFSLTFQLSPELELCNGLASITEGTYLNAIGGTNFQVLDNGGGSYTVDAAILGLPCGATAATGTLFSIEVTNTGGDGTGTITVTGLILRDCVNVDIPGIAGSTTLQIDNTAVSAITDLAAAQQLTGNDGDGTTVIDLSWTAPAEPDAYQTQIWRKGFGFYPEYDDLGGSAPTAPANPVDALSQGWTLVATLPASSSSQADETALERDFMYFVAFVSDSCGNISGVSNVTDGTLNYHLGDVVPVTPPPFGDNLVDVLDISKLGAHYGTSDGDALYLDTLDVGPTSTNFVDGLPDTDDSIQFEDLILFAINFGQVSKPAPPVDGEDLLVVRVPELPAAGDLVVSLDMTASGRIQGLSIPLGWDPAVVKPVSLVGGELLDRQTGVGVALAPSPGTVDVAVFGSALSGTGTVAQVRFEVLGAGDPGISLGEVTARDGRNQPVELVGSVEGDRRVVPVATRFLGASPNPFRAATRVNFTLAQETPVVARIHSVDGRLVRTLFEGSLGAGERSVSWNGLDANGRPAAAGVYVLQFRAGTLQESRRIVRLR